MGFLYDLYNSKKKKLCTMCGCILYPDSDSDICEVCLDELYESDPGPIEDEPGYPCLPYYNEND